VLSLLQLLLEIVVLGFLLQELALEALEVLESDCHPGGERLLSNILRQDQKAAGVNLFLLKGAAIAHQREA
jgi:hypothetical protein